METAARWALAIGLLFLVGWLIDKKRWPSGGAWLLAIALFFGGSFGIDVMANELSTESALPSRVAPQGFIPPVAPAVVPTVSQVPSNPQCHPSYSEKCVPIASDVDCAGGSGNGPYYVGRVRVIGPDVYDLDRDNDGVGCE